MSVNLVWEKIAEDRKLLCQKTCSLGTRKTETWSSRGLRHFGWIGMLLVMFYSSMSCLGWRYLRKWSRWSRGSSCLVIWGDDMFEEWGSAALLDPLLIEMMDLQCSSRSEAIGLGSITFTPNLEACLQKPISKCGPVNLSAFIRMSSAI